MKEIFFNTQDNIKIAANHYDTGSGSVLITAPGWFMTKDSKPFKAMNEEFSKYFSVLGIDFRGHGRSGGCFNFTSTEVLDLKAVIDFAAKNYKNIFLAGFSLGGASSILAAAEDKRISKLIAASAPADFDKIENHFWKKEALLPTLKKCELKVWFSIRAGRIKGKKIKPIDVIEKVSCPSLFIAGEIDPTVYKWHTKALYDKCRAAKKYTEFENGYHAEDLYLMQHDKFMKECLDWLLEK